LDGAIVLVEVEMTTRRRKLYSSSNGDVWFLCRDRDGQIVISHEPNFASGGRASQVEIGTFLTKGNKGPEHQALLHLIGELVDPDHIPTPAQLARDREEHQ
jgi:hypothetical protein